MTHFIKLHLKYEQLIICQLSLNKGVKNSKPNHISLWKASCLQVVTVHLHWIASVGCISLPRNS